MEVFRNIDAAYAGVTSVSAKQGIAEMIKAITFIEAVPFKTLIIGEGLRLVLAYGSTVGIGGDHAAIRDAPRQQPPNVHQAIIANYWQLEKIDGYRKSLPVAFAWWTSTLGRSPWA